jgi:hypothetical protein
MLPGVVASSDVLGRRQDQSGCGITLDTYGHLFPDELDQLTGRLEAARAVALEARRASQMWPRSGPAVVSLSKGAGQ